MLCAPEIKSWDSGEDRTRQVALGGPASSGYHRYRWALRGGVAGSPLSPSLSVTPHFPTLPHPPLYLIIPLLPFFPFSPRSHNYCQLFTKPKVSFFTKRYTFSFNSPGPKSRETSGNALSRPPKHQQLVVGVFSSGQSRLLSHGGDFTGQVLKGRAIRTLENCTTSHENVLHPPLLYLPPVLLFPDRRNRSLWSSSEPRDGMIGLSASHHHTGDSKQLP